MIDIKDYPASDDRRFEETFQDFEEFLQDEYSEFCRDDETVVDLSGFEVDYDCAAYDDADSCGDFGVEENTPLLSENYPEECSDFFAQNGALSRATADSGRNFEYREGQQQMAKSVAEALFNGENLCVEAPTGIGKSFAYLLPLILRSRNGGRAAIVSTETINLQEQLFEKDIPFLKKITGIEFKAALAKGRRNYLCRRRFSLLSGAERDALLPAPSLALDIDRIADWIELGNSGCRDAIDFKIDPASWSLVACESSGCASAKCPFFRNCFYYKARRQWEVADIIVANHALFFTDLAMRCGEDAAGTLLPNYGAVLIDEAHTIENNAAEHLGLHLSRQGMLSELHRLYNPDTARGLLMHSGAMLAELRGIVAETEDEIYGFFSPYAKHLEMMGESSLRIDHLCDFPDRLSGKLLNLASGLDRAVEGCEDETLRIELQSHRDRCASLADSVVAFTRRQIPEAVYYIEREGMNSVSLHASPLNIAELLRQYLFEQDFPVLMCSATLTVGGLFDYYVGRTGFTEGKVLRLDTPFGSDQAQLCITQTMPDPTSSEFDSALAEEVFENAVADQGGVFVLFTNYQSLRFCAARLRERFAACGRQLLVQGEDLSRSKMLETFKNDGNAVLFGADSFWTGVDVPGSALSKVIITKLPFPNPRHPLVSAREDALKRMGKSSFSHYSLPEAVLKFRQGTGRLIRNKKDRGWIILLDRRLVTKSYGRVFLNSIPYSEC
jgi:ATP-dependent DNA helicase DinG